MASELSKTAISTMRVKALRDELERRGLDATGIRPVLQARLREAAAGERDRGSLPRHSQPRRRIPRTASVVRARGDGLGSATASAVSSRAMSTSAGEPTASASECSIYVMQFDGGSRGNPGPSGAGAVLYRVDDDGRREEVWSGSLWVGQARTNNEAEYSGLIEGLRAAKEMGVKRLVVEGDSKLVIQQMLGNFKVSSSKMIPLHKKAQAIAESFEELDMSHIERALNGRADMLANRAMDTKESFSVTTPRVAQATT